LPDTQALDELKMLMHEPDRHVGLARAFIGCYRPIGDRCEGRFPRAVLTHERVNLTRTQREIDAVDGLYRAEALANLTQGKEDVVHGR
jgi:hypothetical protein